MASEPASPASGHQHIHSAMSWGAVGLACAAALLAALGLVGLGGAGAGMVLALLAFVMAVVARIRHERWVLLWLPLLLFPVLLVTSPLWV